MQLKLTVVNFTFFSCSTIGLALRKRPNTGKITLIFVLIVIQLHYSSKMFIGYQYKCSRLIIIY